MFRKASSLLLVLLMISLFGFADHKQKQQKNKMQKSGRAKFKKTRWHNASQLHSPTKTGLP
jgi:hypothetical protein